MSTYTYDTSPDPDYETSDVSNDKIYITEKQILDQLNDFNAEYAKYVRCNYNNNHPNAPLLNTNGQPLQCSGNEESEQKVQEKYDALTQKIADLKSQISNIPTSSDQNPAPDINMLKMKQSKIMELRNQIDLDLNELNEHENSIAFSKKKVLDSTLYATLLWTTAATILVLVVFTRL